MKKITLLLLTTFISVFVVFSQIPKNIQQKKEILLSKKVANPAFDENRLNIKFKVQDFKKKTLNTPKTDSDSLVGSWNGIDADNSINYFSFPSQVVTEIISNQLNITGLGFGWMSGTWGEEILDSNYVIVEVDEVNKTLNIPYQYYCTTLYNGSEYVYDIYGWGTYDLNGPYPTNMVIGYDLYNVTDSYSVAAWAYQNGYLSSYYFVANLSLGTPEPPIITTTEATDVGMTLATTGGNLIYNGGSLITSMGVVYSTSANPTIEVNEGITNDGTDSGNFTTMIIGLTGGTTYYVRAYATNSIGTSYGEQISFTTSNVAYLPTITTNNVTNLGQTVVTIGGDVTNNGGDLVTARGIVYSTSVNPTIDINEGITSDGTGLGSYTTMLSGLSPETIYYARAYATNSVGTAYGEQVGFITLAIPNDGVYEGTYIVVEGYYYRIGQLNSDDMWVGGIINIYKIDENTYRWENWGELSGWLGNILYFQIDPSTGNITYPTEWNGVPQTLNEQPIITVDLNPNDLTNVIPLAGTDINTAGEGRLNMVYGYYTAGSGPREFYFLLEKVQSTSIQKSDDNSVTVYPNPANDVLYINGLTKQANIYIYDLTGRPVKQEYANNGINISDLTQGLYLVKIETEKGIITKKIIKK